MCVNYTQPQSSPQVPQRQAGDWFCHEASPVLVIISGPSGVGKDRVIERMKEMGHPFHFVVTATTRAPRQGEVHGVDYFFVSKSEFASMIEQGQLLEYAMVYGDYKGIPKQQVHEALASGQDVVMRIDVQGAATLKRLVPGATLIFLTTESEAELIWRLQSRRSESADQLKLRIATAREELKRAKEFDFCVVNRHEQVDETVRQIVAIITAERLRVGRKPVSL